MYWALIGCLVLPCLIKKKGGRFVAVRTPLSVFTAFFFLAREKAMFTACSIPKRKEFWCFSFYLSNQCMSCLQKSQFQIFQNSSGASSAKLRLFRSLNLIFYFIIFVLFYHKKRYQFYYRFYYNSFLLFCFKEFKFLFLPCLQHVHRYLNW